ncbi:MAG: FAD-binding protein [Chloroflexi bacterium]|nr:MAG: FAD-binding protein [Chloroflexota bacterium]
MRGHPDRARETRSRGGHVGVAEIDGLRPAEVVRAETEAHVVDAIRAANERGEAVLVASGRTRLDVGDPLERCDTVLELSSLRGLIEHEAGDLVATVRAGTTLTDLADALAQTKQRWPVEAGAPDRATVGGTIASAAFGPSRLRYFHPRDWILGAKVVLGDATCVRSGGKVVKNVTGYDLTRLWSGTFGTLAAICEVTLKLTAIPERTTTLQADLSVPEALRIATELHTTGLPLDALAIASGAPAQAIGSRDGAALLIRLAGPAAAVRRLGRSVRERVRCRDVANEAWDGIASAPVSATWAARVGWPAARTPALDFVGYDAVIYPANGAAFLLRAIDRATFRRIRSDLEAMGGYAVLERAGPDYKRAVGGAWGASGIPNAIARELKTRFDPRGVLAPGRLPS